MPNSTRHRRRHRDSLERPAHADPCSRLLRAAMAAEREGEFRVSLRFLDRAREPGVVGWRQELEALCRLGADAEPFAWAQWLGHAGLRWLQDFPREEVAGLAHLFVSEALAEATLEDAAWALMSQPLILEAGLFDQGLFDEFLDVVIPGALAVVPEARRWTREPMRVLQCDVHEGPLVHYSTVAGREVTVRSLGTGDGPEPGNLVLARAMPVRADQPCLFLTPPLLLTPEWAERLGRVDSAAERISEIGRYIRST